METEFRKGLKSPEAQARLAEEGPNELGVSQRRTLFVMIAEVVREPMFLLLLGAGAIYAVMGDLHEAAILMGFVLLIMGVTVLQERRTENALEALRDLSSPRALVIRDGEPIRIPGREVVREDIIILAEGDRVPADGKVLQAHELAVDESMLTGESEAVAKFAEADGVFAGTLVVRGQGLMQASATGGRTRLGLIGKSLQDIQIEASPLRDEVGLLTQRLAVIGVCLCVVLTLIYWAIRGGWLDGILAGITLAMGILPQEFPVIMIVFLALGARRIASQRVLTRRLNAIETLGETTVLCVDKTGTLTENRMTLVSLAVEGEVLDVSQISSAELPEAYHELLEFAVLASEIEPHDPMEQAFHKFAHRYLANTEHLHPDWSLAREYELSPGLLAMSHLWQEPSGERDVVAAKGAAEAIADLCHMSAEAQRTLMLQVDSLADLGQRVLGVAKAHHKADTGWPVIQHDFDFEFLGLLGLADPLRAEVPEAIAECRRAGIRVVMITGDHPRTALAIARAAGLDTAKVLTGAELENVAQDDPASDMSHANVFARVTPQQKLSIVDALKSHGEVVAMTGDGVNDAPALKSAHIGIAMGKRGTDVAREAASLVLLEDDFSAIVAAVRLGRRIFANLRQALVYTLAVHIPIIGLSVLPLLSGLPLVLMPIHIAFLELIIDPACSIVFEAEQGSAALMRVPPRSVNERLVSGRQILLSMLQGLLSTAVVIGFYWSLVKSGTPVEQARALAFITLVAANAVLILPCRSAGVGLKEMFVGFSLVGGIVLLCTFASLAAITMIPMLAGAFGFQPPSLAMWGLAFLCGLGTLVLFEAAKLALRGWPCR